MSNVRKNSADFRATLKELLLNIERIKATSLL